MIALCLKWVGYLSLPPRAADTLRVLYTELRRYRGALQYLADSTGRLSPVRIGRSHSSGTVKNVDGRNS